MPISNLELGVWWLLALVGGACLPCVAASGEPVVPGTGRAIRAVGDDFEDRAHWQYLPHFPKSSRNLDKRERSPLAESSNGRWLEGPHRGTPDVMRLVKTPPGGLADSRWSLWMQSRQTGVPGKPSLEPQQDDVMVKVKRILGRPVPTAWSPSCVVRVYVPPFHVWEQRPGASFGFRTDLWGTRGSKRDEEQYWPGLFVNFRPASSRHPDDASAFLMIRGDERGQDVRGPDITPGWWTLGLSVSPDGECHFYAREGVEDLTPEDHLASYFCYSYRAERMDLFFFNIVAMDDNHTSSTPWIIDDPTFYCDVSTARKTRQSQVQLR